MDDINLTSASSPSSILKSVCSPATGLTANSKQRNDSASVIQQSDVSSSRPALLAHDVLGPLLFEALDGFFFTINHNCELDFVSDNVGQYLKFSQEELAGRNLYCCVHPSDVSEFSKAWAKKDAGDSLTPTAVTDQPRGRTFLCRMRTNDESMPYITMVVSVALHRDSSGSDKTFLICIARRPPVNELKDKPALLGFDQFSSRINLQYEIESLDASHIKCETIDMKFQGKNFRDYVFVNDIPLVIRHFQEAVENGESKSAIYRFCLHDDIYAFVNTQSKLFSNTTTGKSESIVSTHTIVRLIDNPHDLHGNASTRLMKSIIISNRDLQKNKHQSSSSSNKAINTPPLSAAPPPTSTPPIGTQFALTMLGMHKNASNSLQQHVTSTLGTLIQVQNSLSVSSPIDKSQQPFNVPSPPRTITQKSSTLDNVSSSDTVEFGSKRTAFSPPFNSVHSNHGSIPSPTTSFDLSFTSVSPSNDLSFLLPNCSPATKRALSPLQSIDPTSLLFSNHDIYTTSSSPRTTTPGPSLQSRNSTRLRQLLATKSPTSPIPNQHETKTHLNGFDEYVQVAESPTTTHVSPLPNDQPSPTKRRRNLSQTNGALTNSADILLKQILGRQAPLMTMTSAPNASDGVVQENHSGWPSPSSVPLIKTDPNNSDDSASGGLARTSSGSVNKLRSDIFLRTLLNDEVRPQKVVVEAPFAYNSRHKYNQRASAGANLLLGINHNKSLGNNAARSSFKSQQSFQTANSLEWDPKNKKKQRQHSHTFGARPNAITTISPPRRPGRPPKRDPTDYLLSNPQSTISENSLDSLLDSSSTNLDQPSPIALRRTTRQTSSSNPNFKRTIDNNEDPLFNPRKYPKLLTQALKDDIKIECTDHSIISPSVALAATRPLIQSSHTIIKTEPEIPFLFEKTPSPSLKRSTNHTPSSASQSTLLRSLIRTPHTQSITTKKDAPLYDLLQNLDSDDTSIFSSLNSTSSSANTDKHSIDPLEQYLTPALTQSTPVPKTSLSKDNYLAALLSTDPQQPNEISFIPSTAPQAATLARPSSASSDNSRIAAIVNDLFVSTANAAAATATNSSNDDFLSLLDNKDFLECINDPTTIDSILSQNSASVTDMSLPSTTPKRSEKDERAISEIYKTLVTSFNPGSSSLDLPVDQSPFSSITGDFLFAENSTMSLPPNRTALADPTVLMYRQQQQQTTYPYQNAPQQQSSNSSQFPDCLTMDMIDNNTFPPNVSLSPMTNSYLSSPTIGTNHMETNSMMMHTQQQPTHTQHHQPQNQMSNPFYRQTTQTQQQTMYNSYGQPSQNQVASAYYPMQQQQPSQQRMPSAHHPSQLNKRQALMHQQRTPQQNNQQLQLHMSMNVTLPHMAQNQQQLLPQQQQSHRPMMNTYNDLMLPNGNSPSLQQDFHRYSPANSANNNPLDLLYNHDLFISPSPSSGLSTSQQQQLSQNRHINVMQSQQQSSVPSSQAAMHQPYSNMSVALSATIQQNSNTPNNLMNSSGSNLTSTECRQSEELNNQMMNCLSFPPTRFTSEFVRKQLQNTIHGRQKPAGGIDVPTPTGQKMINSPNLDSNQKGAYFRSQLSSQMSTPPLQPNMRSQQQQPSKTSM